MIHNCPRSELLSCDVDRPCRKIHNCPHSDTWAPTQCHSAALGRKAKEGEKKIDNNLISPAPIPSTSPTAMPVLATPPPHASSSPPPSMIFPASNTNVPLLQTPEPTPSPAPPSPSKFFLPPRETQGGEQAHHQSNLNERAHVRDQPEVHEEVQQHQQQQQQGEEEEEESGGGGIGLMGHGFVLPGHGTPNMPEAVYHDDMGVGGGGDGVYHFSEPRSRSPSPQEFDPDTPLGGSKPIFLSTAPVQEFDDSRQGAQGTIGANQPPDGTPIAPTPTPRPPLPPTIPSPLDDNHQKRQQTAPARKPPAPPLLSPPVPSPRVRADPLPKKEEVGRNRDSQTDDRMPMNQRGAGGGMVEGTERGEESVSLPHRSR